VEKLRSSGHVREIQYPTWLANVVLVLKSNGKWRMCTNFTDLNKACPKDAYPLPNIDSLVDGVSGCELLSFMVIIKSKCTHETKIRQRSGEVWPICVI